MIVETNFRWKMTFGLITAKKKAPWNIKTVKKAFALLYLQQLISFLNL